MTDQKNREMTGDQLENVNGGYVTYSIENGPVAYTVNVDTSLNMRSGPSLNDRVIGSLYKGDTLYFLEAAADGYWKMSCPERGLVGYVSQKYIVMK